MTIILAALVFAVAALVAYLDVRDILTRMSELLDDAQP